MSTLFLGCRTVFAQSAVVPTVDLRANGSDLPISVKAGDQVVLTWTTANAVACTAFGSWSGPQPVQGTQAVGAVTGNKLYSLTCAGANGSASDTVVVSVAGGSAIQANAADSSSDPTNVAGPQIASGGSFQLSASASSLANSAITYAWSCSAGTLSNKSDQNPVYYAPTVSRSIVATCRLTASDASGHAAARSIDITIVPVSAGIQPATSGQPVAVAVSQSRLRTEINQLQSEIAQLEQQLIAIMPSGTATASGTAIPVAISIANVTALKPFAKNVVAIAGDTLTFLITVTEPAQTLSNFTINNDLPKFVNAAQNLKINGADQPGSIAQGLNVGSLKPGDNQITFTAQVQAGAVPQTATDLVAAYSDGMWGSDKATITIIK